jgi:hypothetical protein
MSTLHFWRGERLYQVAPAYSGEGFIGISAGRIVATAPDRAGVARALILSDRWRREGKADDLVTAPPARVDQERWQATRGVGTGA